jgi:UDP-N-acetylmuramate dehydrogenase
VTGGIAIERNTPLAPRTTLRLGGAAEHFCAPEDEAGVGEALAWADAHALPVTVLGGGSNVVVSDAGLRGLVMGVNLRGTDWQEHGRVTRVTVSAGEPWDAFVAEAVARGLAGVECLAGIPGLVGAAPIQNVGAYGQEVAECVVEVRALDRTDGRVYSLATEACAFGYRDSAFKRDPARWVVLAVTFELRRDGAPKVAYDELARALEARGAAPTLAAVRETVLSLRRAKSMVIDPADENRHSAGSFFVNPMVTLSEAERVVEAAVRTGLVACTDDVPRWPAPDGRVKLAAGWLVERAGFAKGSRRGAVGVSSRHALALVHHGGGTSAALLALAREVRDRVRARFGVTLVPEPVFLGFGGDPLA